jgi:serine/threonine-protein kinase ULK/ATG1
MLFLLLFVQPFFRMQESNRIYLVLEFCAGGDLSHFIRRYGRVDENTVRHLMAQLAEGLKELRVHNVIHVSDKPYSWFEWSADHRMALRGKHMHWSKCR